MQANGLGPLATKLTLEEAEMLAARWALGVWGSWGSWGSRVYALVIFFFAVFVSWVGRFTGSLVGLVAQADFVVAFFLNLVCWFYLA